MLKINCLELLEARSLFLTREKLPVLLDNSLFHAAFSCTEHIYCENIF